MITVATVKSYKNELEEKVAELNRLINDAVQKGVKVALDINSYNTFNGRENPRVSIEVTVDLNELE